MQYEDIPFFWINRLSSLSRRELTQQFEKAGHKISPEEWALLLVLWGKGSQSPSALSDATIKDRTTVTRLIDGMVRKGLVVRSENVDDRRRSDIALTPYGSGLQSELVPFAMKIIARATSGVPPEDLETTLRTLKAFNRNLTSPNS
jgi:DNA-binding MarR family transcriptional regulator